MEDRSTTTTPATRAGVFIFKEAPVADLADALKKLVQLTPLLNASTDGANAAFRATEEILSRIGVGINASTVVKTLSQDVTSRESTSIDGERYTQPVVVARDLLLVYERIAGKHRIGFQENVVEFANALQRDQGNQTRDEYLDAVAWDQAPREWKLEGAAALPALINNLATRGESLAKAAAATTAAVDEILRDLKAAQITAKLLAARELVKNQ